MISFTTADLDRFLSEDDREPLVILNLVRFRRDGGQPRYGECLGMAGPLVTRYGAASSSLIALLGKGNTP